MSNRFLIWVTFCVLPLSSFPWGVSAGSRKSYRKRHHYHFHYFHLRSPDILVPANYQIRGIDISKYQSAIDWDKIKDLDSGENQLTFVFIKATDGTSRQDIQFRSNWKAARDAGLVCGAYHFFYPSRDPMIQARNFEKTVHLEPGDLPPVLDIEVANRQSARVIRKRALLFLREMRRKFGVTPIIYTNSHFYKRYLGSSFNSYPLWISDFQSPELPRTRREWLFWQWSDRVHVDGIGSPVDYNIFNGNDSDLKKILVPDKP